MKKDELTNVWGIYKILNIVNGKFYIGSSTNLRKRLYEHYRELSLGIHTNKHLQNAWIKYGKNGFKFQVLEKIEDLTTFTNEDLRNLETDYILKTQCFKSGIGYNIIQGGFGTINTPCSEEKRKKISKANKSKPAWNKGVAMSEEQKEKLKQINIAKRSKAVDIYKGNGDFIETLPSINSVVDKYGVTKVTVTDQCKGRKGGKNFIFKYHNNPIELDKTYTKNKTYTEKSFYIYNLTRDLLNKVQYKKDVIFFLTNSTKRNGNIERKLKQCVDNNESICLYDKYIIEFKNALDDSNVINEPRQLDKDDIKGTNSANGEA